MNPGTNKVILLKHMVINVNQRQILGLICYWMRNNFRFFL